MVARTCEPRASDGWSATGSRAVRVASLGDHVHPIVFSSPVEGSSMRCTHAVLLASTMVRSARCSGRGPSRPEAVCAPCTGPLSPYDTFTCGEALPFCSSADHQDFVSPLCRLGGQSSYLSGQFWFILYSDMLPYCTLTWGISTRHTEG